MAVQEAGNTLTEGGDGHVVKHGKDNDRLGPASTLEDVKEGDEEGKEWACEESDEHVAVHRRITH